MKYRRVNQPIYSVVDIIRDAMTQPEWSSFKVNAKGNVVKYPFPIVLDSETQKDTVATDCLQWALTTPSGKISSIVHYNEKAYEDVKKMILGLSRNRFKRIRTIGDSESSKKYRFPEVTVLVHNLAYENAQFLQYAIELAMVENEEIVITDKIMADGATNPWRITLSLQKDYTNSDGEVLKPIPFLVFQCSQKQMGCGTLENTTKQILGENSEYVKEKLDQEYYDHAPYKSLEEYPEVWTQYCYNDVESLNEIVEKEMTNNGCDSYQALPMTFTGRTRKRIKEEYQKSKKENRSDTYVGSSLKYTELFLKDSRECAHGGLTVVSDVYNTTIECDVDFWNKHYVTCFDISSSYPAQMVYRKFISGNPMFFTDSTAIESFYNEMVETVGTEEQTHGCTMTVKLTNVSPAKAYHHIHPIFFPKATDYQSALRYRKYAINGKLSYCDEVTLTLSETDLSILAEAYYFDSIEFISANYYEVDYLPEFYIDFLLKCYVDKTCIDKDKDPIGYAVSKVFLNGAYGATYTDFIRESYTYEYGEMSYSVETPDLLTVVDKYNKKGMRRYNFYHWGVQTAAWGRWQLWQAMKHYGDRVLYSDTDSVFVICNKPAGFDTMDEKHIKKHLIQTEKIDCGVESIDCFTADNGKGKTSTLGIWDVDKICKEFKCIAPKRYAYRTLDNNIHYTVAGINENNIKSYIGDNMEEFNTGLVIPSEYSGKLAHEYGERTDRKEIDKYGKYYCRLYPIAFELKPTMFEEFIQTIFPEMG